MSFDHLEKDDPSCHVTYKHIRDWLRVNVRLRFSQTSDNVPTLPSLHRSYIIDLFLISLIFVYSFTFELHVLRNK